MSYLDEFFDARKKQPKLSPEAAEKAKQQALEDQRQRAINYKKFFGELHGQTVMLDLMNKFYMNSPDTNDPIALAKSVGRREVVEYLLARANVSMEQLDKILKGEF